MTDERPNTEQSTSAEDPGLSDRREAGETAGYIGGPVQGNAGAAGIRQLEADEADERDTESDANLAQSDG